MAKQRRLVNYSTINYVDLYETRSVMHTEGHGVRRNGISSYSSTSTSSQQWTNLGRGSLTINGTNCYFVGGANKEQLIEVKLS